jgi:hypothetical protein
VRGGVEGRRGLLRVRKGKSALAFDTRRAQEVLGHAVQELDELDGLGEFCLAGVMCAQYLEHGCTGSEAAKENLAVVVGTGQNFIE